MRRGEEKYGQAIAAVFDIPEDRRLSGHIALKRGGPLASTVQLCDDTYFSIEDGATLHGISQEGKVSLLDCQFGTPSTTSSRDFTIYHCDLPFRYAVFGKQHLYPEDKSILGIQFTFDEIDTILSNDGHGTFGRITNPDDEIIDTIERKRPDHLRGELRRDGSAMVSYFTGEYDLLPRTETVLGTISASRTLHVDNFGRSIRDEPHVTIDFDDEAATLETALEKIRIVRQFFSWVTGYAARWRCIRVFTSKLGDGGYRVNADGSPSSGLEVFTPIGWRYSDDDNSRSATQRNALIDASRDPDQFADVMRNWLERNNDGRRRSANTRFFGSMRGMPGSTIEDEICSAANAFDLLPSSDKPQKSLISEETRVTLDEAATRIKKLGCADTEERQEVLNQLGRIRGYVKLRHIVESRAKIVVDNVGEAKLPHIDKLIRAAVRCRNHYTHGADVKNSSDPDFSDPFVVFVLIATLEFIYGVSELLICGWNMDGGFEKMQTDHPFSSYIRNYEWRLSRIRLG